MTPIEIVLSGDISSSVTSEESCVSSTPKHDRLGVPLIRVGFRPLASVDSERAEGCGQCRGRDGGIY